MQLSEDSAFGSSGGFGFPAASVPFSGTVPVEITSADEDVVEGGCAIAVANRSLGKVAASLAAQTVATVSHAISQTEPVVCMPLDDFNQTIDKSHARLTELLQAEFAAKLSLVQEAATERLQEQQQQMVQTQQRMDQMQQRYESLITAWDSGPGKRLLQRPPLPPG